MSITSNNINIVNTGPMDSDTMTCTESVIIDTDVTNKTLMQQIEDMKTEIKIMKDALANTAKLEKMREEEERLKKHLQDEKVARELEVRLKRINLEKEAHELEEQLKVLREKDRLDKALLEKERLKKERATFINKIVQQDIYVNGEITQIKPYATNMKVLNKKGSVTYINDTYGANVNFTDGTGGLQIPFEQISLTIAENSEWIAFKKKEKEVQDAFERERTEARRFVYNAPMLVGGPPLVTGVGRNLGFLTVYPHAHPFGRVTYTF